MLIPPPFYLGSILTWELFSLNFLLVVKSPQWALVPGHVEIFMHVVQDELEEFLGVLLLINAPLGIEMTAYPLFQSVNVSNHRD